MSVKELRVEWSPIGVTRTADDNSKEEEKRVCGLVGVSLKRS
jgi:hypothetical protein